MNQQITCAMYEFSNPIRRRRKRGDGEEKRRKKGEKRDKCVVMWPGSQSRIGNKSLVVKIVSEFLDEKNTYLEHSQN